jgi:hypothetical protein
VKEGVDRGRLPCAAGGPGGTGTDQSQPERLQDTLQAAHEVWGQLFFWGGAAVEFIKSAAAPVFLLSSSLI